MTTVQTLRTPSPFKNIKNGTVSPLQLLSYNLNIQAKVNDKKN